MNNSKNMIRVRKSRAESMVVGLEKKFHHYYGIILGEHYTGDQQTACEIDDSLCVRRGVYHRVR